MLTEIYIEALLVDEELADQVWEEWDTAEIDDQIAFLAWWLMTFLRKFAQNHYLTLGQIQIILTIFDPT